MMTWKMRYLVGVSYRFVRSRKILDRRRYQRRRPAPYDRREEDDDRRFSSWDTGRRLSNDEYKWLWA